MAVLVTDRMGLDGSVLLNINGTATPSGSPLVPSPVSVPSRSTDVKPLTAAVVCTVPSGNLYPPRVVSIIPCTDSFDIGVARPMPMLPFNCVIMESPRVELPEGLVPVHIEIFPTVPLPSTAGGEMAAAVMPEMAAAVMPLQ